MLRTIIKTNMKVSVRRVTILSMSLNRSLIIALFL